MSPRKQKIHQPLGASFTDVVKSIADEQKPISRLIPAKPFLKWVGGKRSIMDELIRRLPAEYETYYEPFLGGGALYFAVQPDDAVLADVNFHLIITFKAVRDDLETLIGYLKVHEQNHNKAYYYKCRLALFTETDKTKIAGLFIYLNKTCFNGLYRVNKQGQFNVPMGSYTNPAILDEPNLRNASKLLQTADIQQSDYSQFDPQKGDFFYIDPPYHTTFSQYSDGGFGDQAHTDLANFARKIDFKDGYFMVSNSDTPFVRELYKGYNIEQVSASRSVSCKGYQRGKENELIIRNYN